MVSIRKHNSYFFLHFSITPKPFSRLSMNINAGKRLVSLDSNENYKYMGYTLNGKRDGDGLLIDFEKDYFYDGEWKMDKMHGFGKLKLGIKRKGEYHEGYFDNNLYNGPGINLFTHQVNKI